MQSFHAPRLRDPDAPPPCFSFIPLQDLLKEIDVGVRFEITSPYLFGTWEETGVISTTGYHLVNPTTKPLDVHMSFYAEGEPFACISSSLPANGTFYRQALVAVSRPSIVEAGTVKFFAFPAGTTKFDPNALIGGFQRKTLNGNRNDPSPYVFNAEANLKAVTINSSTIKEFTQIPWDWCRRVPG